MEVIKKYRYTILMGLDAVQVLISCFIVFLLLGSSFATKAELTLSTLVVLVGVHTLCFMSFHLYKIIWRYATVRQLIKCAFSAFAAESILFLLLTVCTQKLPALFFVLEFFLVTFLLIISRMAYILMRAYRADIQKKMEEDKQIEKSRTLIVGAGEATKILLNDIYKNSHVAYEPVCLVDDELSKQKRTVHGVKVQGKIEDIPKLCEKYDVKIIIFSILSIDSQRKKEILHVCSKTNCVIKKVPNYKEFVEKKENISRNIQNISIHDLLGREPVKIENKRLLDFIGGRVVMVTGGGGSIGSELCRQIAALHPRQLIILDIYENNAYSIQQELIRKYGTDLDLKVEIASVRDKNKLEVVFKKYRPEVVYHAAAHKHVPLMENSPEEAVKNNVFGTYHTAKFASKYGVKRFVLVSTDKAVNPTNIMGATKRCCEMIVQAMDTICKTEFVAVRFGNVLGSNGSVIPLFEQQIAAGGPVTVTHPDIIRYFMTIPEAAQLLLAAGSMAKGGEIFILDMGDPVKITDLAKNLIKLSGYVPGRDIEIKFIGLRPGEKLFEELLLNEEGIQKTATSQIYIGSPLHMDQEKFFRQISELKVVAEKNDSREVCKLLAKIVPTYHQPKEQFHVTYKNLEDNEGDNKDRVLA